MHRAVSAPRKGQLSLSIGDFASPQARSDTTGPSFPWLAPGLFP